MKRTPALFALIAVPGMLFAQQTYRSGSSEPTERMKTPAALKSVCDTTWLFQTAQPFPSGLATDGDGYWIGDADLPQIFRVGLDGSPISTLAVPSTFGSSGLYFDGTYLWAVVEDEGALLQYDLTSGTVVATYTLPFQSSDNNHWGVTGETGALWVSVYAVGSNTELLKIDPADGTVLDTVEVALPLVLGLIILDGDLYGIDWGSQSILQLDRTTGAVLSSTPWCLSYPLGVTSSVETGLVGVSSSIGGGGDQEVIQLNYDPSGIADPLPEGTFTVHPVPASDQVILGLGNGGQGELRLMDVSGQEVMHQRVSGEHAALAVDQLPAGLYIAHVDDGTTFRTGRVVVAH